MTEAKTHPGKPHSFRVRCTECDLRGTLHVSVITDYEVVLVKPIDMVEKHRMCEQAQCHSTDHCVRCNMVWPCDVAKVWP
jgi:hypothetical protein